MTFHRKDTASGEFSCAPEILYEILTDYDSYKDWMPKVHGSALVTKEGDLAIASLDFAPEGKAHLSLECIHTTNRSLLCRAIEDEALLKSVEWTIEDLGADRSRVSVAAEVPVHLGASSLPSAKDAIAGLRAFAAAYSPELEGEAGEKIIEISETENGLVCWFNGQQYEMRPIAK